MMPMMMRIMPMTFTMSNTGSDENWVNPYMARISENGNAKMMVDARSALLTLALPRPRDRIYKT